MVLRISTIVLFVVVSFVGISANADEISRKSGKVKLKIAKSSFDKKASFHVKLGKQLKTTCNFRISKFFDSTVVMAGAEMINTSKKDLYYAYYVAFFDKAKNLIGCATQVSSMSQVQPGAKTNLGSCIIYLPMSEIKKITSYQVILIESDKKVGQ